MVWWNSAELLWLWCLSLPLPLFDSFSSVSVCECVFLSKSRIQGFMEKVTSLCSPSHKCFSSCSPCECEYLHTFELILWYWSFLRFLGNIVMSKLPVLCWPYLDTVHIWKTTNIIRSPDTDRSENIDLLRFAKCHLIFYQSGVTRTVAQQISEEVSPIVCHISQKYGFITYPNCLWTKVCLRNLIVPVSVWHNKVRFHFSLIALLIKRTWWLIIISEHALACMSTFYIIYLSYIISVMSVQNKFWKVLKSFMTRVCF